MNSRFMTRGNSIWPVGSLIRGLRWEKSSSDTSSIFWFFCWILFSISCLFSHCFGWLLCWLPCCFWLVTKHEFVPYLKLSCTHILIIVELYYWLGPVVVYFSHWEGFSTLKIIVSLVVVILVALIICCCSSQILASLWNWLSTPYCSVRVVIVICCWIFHHIIILT